MGGRRTEQLIAISKALQVAGLTLTRALDTDGTFVSDGEGREYVSLSDTTESVLDDLHRAIARLPSRRRITAGVAQADAALEPHMVIL